MIRMLATVLFAILAANLAAVLALAGAAGVLQLFHLSAP